MKVQRRGCFVDHDARWTSAIEIDIARLIMDQLTHYGCPIGISEVNVSEDARTHKFRFEWLALKVDADQYEDIFDFDDFFVAGDTSILIDPNLMKGFSEIATRRGGRR